MITFVVSSFWKCCRKQLKFANTSCVNLLAMILMQAESYLHSVLYFQYVSSKSYGKELNLCMKYFSHEKERNSEFIQSEKFWL